MSRAARATYTTVSGLLCAVLLAACSRLAPLRKDAEVVGPGHPAFVPEDASGAPPRRTKAELAAVLADAKEPPQFPDALKILLVAGAPDRDKGVGVGEHDFAKWQRAWAPLLRGAPAVTVQTSVDWPSAISFTWADVIVFNSANLNWSDARADQLAEFLKAGKGAVFLHRAIDGATGPNRLADIVGLVWTKKHGRARKGAVDVSFAGARGHEIVRGFTGLQLVDEVYFRLEGDESRVNVLASSAEQGGPQPLLWTSTRKGGRVFVSGLGHNNWTFNDPLFRLLILRGISWAAKQHPERLTALATVGVPMD